MAQSESALAGERRTKMPLAVLPAEVDQLVDTPPLFANTL
jgi:hypothetical protein